MSTLMGLGPFRFYAMSLPFHEISRDTEYEWIKQRRLARDPAYQFIGPDDDKIEIEGKLFPHVFGGLEQLSGMRDAARTGRPYMLVGPRYVYGRWCITKIKDKGQFYDALARPRQVDFTISLTAYGEDRAGDTWSLF